MIPKLVPSVCLLVGHRLDNILCDSRSTIPCNGGCKLAFSNTRCRSTTASTVTIWSRMKYYNKPGRLPLSLSLVFIIFIVFIIHRYARMPSRTSLARRRCMICNDIRRVGTERQSTSLGKSLDRYFAQSRLGISLFKANLDSRKAQSGIPENYVITKIDPIRAGFRE